MSDRHSLRRTSPKGPGQAFIGTCTKCGVTGLTFADAQTQECSNPGNLSQDDALLIALENNHE